MAFQFPLAPVLRVRRIVEEREERLLQQILHEIAQALGRLKSIREQIAGGNFALQANLHKPSSGFELHAAYSEKQQLKQSMVELEDRLQKLEQLRDKQFAAYELARRNREMLTDMREEQRSEYDSGVAKREQKIQDDNFIARRGRP